MTLDKLFNNAKCNTQDAGYEEGHVSHRKNGDYIKQGGSWVPMKGQKQDAGKEKAGADEQTMRQSLINFMTKGLPHVPEADAKKAIEGLPADTLNEMFNNLKEQHSDKYLAQQEATAQEFSPADLAEVSRFDLEDLHTETNAAEDKFLDNFITEMHEDRTPLNEIIERQDGIFERSEGRYPEEEKAYKSLREKIMNRYGKKQEAAKEQDKQEEKQLKHSGQPDQSPEENLAAWENSAKTEARALGENQVMLQNEMGDVTFYSEGNDEAIEKAESKGFKKMSLVRPDGSVKRHQGNNPEKKAAPAGAGSTGSVTPTPKEQDWTKSMLGTLSNQNIEDYIKTLRTPNSAEGMKYEDPARRADILEQAYKQKKEKNAGWMNKITTEYKDLIAKNPKLKQYLDMGRTSQLEVKGEGVYLGEEALGRFKELSRENRENERNGKRTKQFKMGTVELDEPTARDLIGNYLNDAAPKLTGDCKVRLSKIKK